LFKDIIQLHISCPSDKEEEKSTKDVSEKEDKDKSKEKVPRKMLSRGEGCPFIQLSFGPQCAVLTVCVSLPSLFVCLFVWGEGVLFYFYFVIYF
jgi:hypothetical protein